MLAALPIAPEASTTARADEEWQGSKLARNGAMVAAWDREFEGQLLRRLRQQADSIASPVLCVGARLGAEVRAFRAAVPQLLAVGTDFNPGSRNPFVMWGDAHELQFSDASFAVVYTNVLDHIRNTSTFAREAHRVLKPGGTLWVEMDQNPPDAYAIHDLRKERIDMVRHFTGSTQGQPPLFGTRNETLLTTTGCGEKEQAAVPFVHGPCPDCPQHRWHLGEGARRKAECVEMRVGSEKDLPKWIHLFQKL